MPPNTTKPIIVVRGLTSAVESLRRYPAELKRAMETTIDIGSRIVKRHVAAQVSGRALKLRTGETAKSIKRRVSKREGLARVGSDKPWLVKHETGGTITPKKGLLAVPIPNSPAAGAFFSNRPADYFHRFVKRKEGRAVLFGAVAQGGQPVPLFVLKRSVTLKARRPFERASTEARTPLIKLYAQQVVDGIRRGRVSGV